MKLAQTQGFHAHKSGRSVCASSPKQKSSPYPPLITKGLQLYAAKWLISLTTKDLHNAPSVQGGQGAG